jgi:hypothetical protein
MAGRAALNLHKPLPNPDVLAREILAGLSAAPEQFKGIVEEPGGRRLTLHTILTPGPSPKSQRSRDFGEGCLLKSPILNKRGTRG